MTVQATKKDAKTRRREIVAAARSALANNGPAALSLRAIANTVGIKLASLQYHFPTYGDLIGALADDTARRYSDRLESLVADNHDSGQDRLKSILYWLAVEDPMSEEDMAFEVQFWALSLTDPAAHDALQRNHDQYLDFLATHIASARPELDAADVAGKAIAIASLMEGSVLFVDLPARSAEQQHASHQVYDAACAIALA